MEREDFRSGLFINKAWKVVKRHRSACSSVVINYVQHHRVLARPMIARRILFPWGVNDKTRINRFEFNARTISNPKFDACLIINRIPEMAAVKSILAELIFEVNQSHDNSTERLVAT